MIKRMVQNVLTDIDLPPFLATGNFARLRVFVYEPNVRTAHGSCEGERLSRGQTIGAGVPRSETCNRIPRAGSAVVVPLWEGTGLAMLFANQARPPNKPA